MGKIRHLGSMPENSGSKFKSPAFRLKLVRKTRKFDLRSLNSFFGGNIDPSLPLNRVKQSYDFFEKMLPVAKRTKWFRCTRHNSLHYSKSIYIVSLSYNPIPQFYGPHDFYSLFTN